MDEATKKELQSAAFDRLIQHLRERKDVLEIGNLEGFFFSTCGGCRDLQKLLHFRCECFLTAMEEYS